MASKYAIAQPEATPISEESARDQVLQLLSFYDYNIEDVADAEKKASIEELLDNLTRFFRQGRLTLDTAVPGSLKVVQNLKNTPGGMTQITYREYSGQTHLAADGKGKDKNFAAMYAAAASLAGLPEGAMEKLQGKDVAVMETFIAVFFLVTA